MKRKQREKPEKNNVGAAYHAALLGKNTKYNIGLHDMQPLRRDNMKPHINIIGGGLARMRGRLPNCKKRNKSKII